MKKKVFALLLAAVLIICFAGCGESEKNVSAEDYCFYMQFREGFNILQITDLHLNVDSDVDDAINYLDKVITEANRKAGESLGKIDLVELTGDTFMLASKTVVTVFIEYMEKVCEKYNMKYAIIWGNHDTQGIYNVSWLTESFENAKHCVFTDLDDNLKGRSNYAINLSTDGTGNSENIWQIINFDSGAAYAESPLTFGKDYDYIRDDQVEWMKQVNDSAGNPSTILYFHIPQKDMTSIWNDVAENNADYYHNFFKLEGMGEADSESKLISEAAEMGNIKAMFYGHAHNNDWTVDYKGMTLGFGVKTSQELYFAHVSADDEENDVKTIMIKNDIEEDFYLIGASLVTLYGNETFKLTHLYYNEREDGDFVKWVNYK